MPWLQVFEDNLKEPVVERLPGRGRDALDAFTLAEGLHLERAVMTKRVIARATEVHVARPHAAGHAVLGVVTALAVSPEIVRRPVPCHPERRGTLPDVTQRIVADVAARIRDRRKRRTALDGAVG